MLPPSFAEKSRAARNSLLATKACQAIRRYQRNGCLDPKDKQLLHRVQELIAKIVQGALLLEDSPGDRDGIAPSSSGLNDYIRAFSAIEHDRDAEMIELLLSVKRRLEAMIEGEGVRGDDLRYVESFLFNLGDAFMYDLKETPQVSRRLSLPVL